MLAYLTKRKSCVEISAMTMTVTTTMNGAAKLNYAVRRILVLLHFKPDPSHSPSKTIQGILSITLPDPERVRQQRMAFHSGTLSSESFIAAVETLHSHEPIRSSKSHQAHETPETNEPTSGHLTNFQRVCETHPSERVEISRPHGSLGLRMPCRKLPRYVSTTASLSHHQSY